MRRFTARILILLAALGLHGCGTLIGTGIAGGEQRGETRTAEEMQMDVRITNRINAAFVNDPLIKALDIRVNSQRGIVTLQGKVATSEVRSRAVRIAESTREVRRVVDRLQVGSAAP